MFVSTKFSYDGETSDLYNTMLIRTDDGLINGQFGVKRNIKTEKIPKKPVFYTFGVEEEPLTFKIQICPIEGFTWDFETRMKIVNWLFKDDYKPFFSTDNIDVIYYCMAVGNPERFYTGNFEGYIEVEFQCNSPYAYTSVYSTVHDFSNNSSTQTISIDNKCNVQKFYFPELQFTTKNGCTKFTIINTTNSGEKFEFTGLNTDETVYINNLKRQIISDSGLYRYDKFNNGWIRLVRGINNLQISADTKGTLNFRYQFPISI